MEKLFYRFLGLEGDENKGNNKDLFLPFLIGLALAVSVGLIGGVAGFCGGLMAVIIKNIIIKSKKR